MLPNDRTICVYVSTISETTYFNHQNIKPCRWIMLQCAFLTPSANNIMFSKLNWLSFSERVKYRKYTLVFKYVNRMTPRYMTNLLTLLKHSRETRQSTHMAQTIHFAKKLLRHEFGCELCNHVERLASTITNNNLFDFVQT